MAPKNKAKENQLTSTRQTNVCAILSYTVVWHRLVPITKSLQSNSFRRSEQHRVAAQVLSSRSKSATSRQARGGRRWAPSKSERRGAGAPLKVGANVAMAVCVRAAHWRVRAGVAKPITTLTPLSGEVAASSRRHVHGGRTRERNTRLGGKSPAWAARVVGSAGPHSAEPRLRSIRSTPPVP